MNLQKTIIFDLSEVIIKGLLGIECNLESILNMNKTEILSSFGGDNLRTFFIGEISEEQYFQRIIQSKQLNIGIKDLQNIVRQEFSQEMPGMSALVTDLSKSNTLILYSDHAIEWVSYILERHPFLSAFSKMVFSYNQKCLKSDNGAFTKLLNELNLKNSEVIFIDDTAVNVKNAKESGIDAIQFKGRFDLEKTLKERFEKQECTVTIE